jgi:hypothetical protein
MDDADVAARGLATEAHEDFPAEIGCPVTEIQAWHRVRELIGDGLYEIPAGSNLRAETTKVWAAARRFWREFRRLPENEVLQY